MNEALRKKIQNIISNNHMVEEEILDVIWESDEPTSVSTTTNKITKVVSVIPEKKSKYSPLDYAEAKLYIGNKDQAQTEAWLSARDYFRNGSSRGIYDTGFFLNNWDDADEATKKGINEAYEKVIWKDIVEERKKDLIEIQNRIISKKWMEKPIRKERIKEKTDKLTDYNVIARWDARFCVLSDEGKKMFAREDEKQYLVNKKWLKYLEEYVDAMLDGSLNEFINRTLEDNMSNTGNYI